MQSGRWKSSGAGSFGESGVRGGSHLLCTPLKAALVMRVLNFYLKQEVCGEAASSLLTPAQGQALCP